MSSWEVCEYIKRLAGKLGHSTSVSLLYDHLFVIAFFVSQPSVKYCSFTFTPIIIYVPKTSCKIL